MGPRARILRGGIAAALVLFGWAAGAAAASCGGGRRCACGDRVVADYALPEDLGPCRGDGLRLVARVNLDGGGHAIRGASPRETAGVVVTAAASGSTVRALEVTGFERGIRLAGAQRVEVLDVHAHHNGSVRAGVGYGIDIAGGASGNRLERVRVHDNADEGIHFGSNARANRLVHSEVRDNARENVYFLDATENSVEDCTIRGGGSNSLYVKNSKATVIARSRIEGRPLTVRGASANTALVDDEISGAGVILTTYDDGKLHRRTRPVRTSIRGGRISGAAVCLRVEGADDTSIDGVKLDCATPLLLSGGSAVDIVGDMPPGVRCTGPGELREIAAGPGGKAAEAGVVRAIRACPGLEAVPAHDVDPAAPEASEARIPRGR